MTSLPTIDKARSSARVIVLAALIVVLVFAGTSLWWWPHQIRACGGMPVPGEIVISVPQFFQGDPMWSDELLGNTPGTLGAEGCAIASASMVLSHYGMDVDPGRLNKFLKENNGYEGAGWLRWESAAEFTSGLIEKAYEDLPSYALIDWNLLKGNPVIVRLRLPSGITHFVVIVGKRGFDYLIRDTSLQGEGKIYPLKELGVPIEALRYYRRLP